MRKLTPRELSNKFGLQSLSTEELLALVLRAGTRNRSVYSLSSEITPLFESSIASDTSTEDFLSQISAKLPNGGIHASVLGSLYELIKRNRPLKLPAALARPQEIVKKYLWLASKRQEYVYGVYVDSRLHITHERLLAKGSTEAVYLEARDILYYAIKYRTRRFLLVHNHPSGDPTPSKSDIDVTKSIASAALLLESELLDHVIIGKLGYYSFREHDLVL